MTQDNQIRTPLLSPDHLTGSLCLSMTMIFVFLVLRRRPFFSLASFIRRRKSISSFFATTYKCDVISIPQICKTSKTNSSYKSMNCLSHDVFFVHIEKTWWQNTPLLESPSNAEPLCVANSSSNSRFLVSCSMLTRVVFHYKGLRLVVRRGYCSQDPRTVRKSRTVRSSVSQRLPQAANCM